MTGQILVKLRATTCDGKYVERTRLMLRPYKGEQMEFDGYTFEVGLVTHVEAGDESATRLHVNVYFLTPHSNPVHSGDLLKRYGWALAS